jgi:hypothetical protein
MFSVPFSSRGTHPTCLLVDSQFTSGIPSTHDHAERVRLGIELADVVVDGANRVQEEFSQYGSRPPVEQAIVDGDNHWRLRGVSHA